MSQFLICTIPAAGHVNPGLPIARALIERGHEVRWYTGRSFRAAIERMGAQFVPMQAAIDPADHSPDERFPERINLSGLAGFKFDLKHLFIDDAPDQVADLRRILRSFPAAVLLGDTGFLGTRLLHELGGPPWATYGITALTFGSRDTAPFGMGLPPAASPLGRLRNRALAALFDHVLFRDVKAYGDRMRSSLHLPPQPGGVLETLSPFLYMHGSTPAFEYPRSDLPPQVHFIGPLLPAPPPQFVPPSWWSDLQSDRSVVLVTQGTVANNADDLIVPTLRALADQNVLVIATTGGSSADQIGLDPPANARIESFVPYAALLPHVDLVITNGGFGGVQFALAHGVPLIVAGTTEDKPEIARRVAWSGAGINLKTKHPTPARIRSAVQTILHDSRYALHAARIQMDCARHDAPQEAAALLERLASTGQPVLRSDRLPAHMPRPIEMAGVEQ